jgi:hypothetical protein
MTDNGGRRVPRPSVLRVRILTWRLAWKKRTAMRFGDFMGRVIFISSPSVVIGDVRILEPCVPATAS